MQTVILTDQAVSSVLTPEPEVPHSHLAPTLLPAETSDEQPTVAERRKHIRARLIRRRAAQRGR